MTKNTTITSAYARTGFLINKKFKEYLVSTIMTSLAMSLAQVVDSVLVGNLLGDEALAANGLSQPFIFIINMIYMLIGVGGMTSASLAKGRRDNQQANRIFTQTILIGFLIMTVYAFTALFLLKPISLKLADGNVNLADLTAQYLAPLVFAGPSLMFTSGTAMFMRMDSYPKTAGIIVLVANAINLILDYLCMAVWNLGIWGAGFSTAMGYALASVLLIPYFKSNKRTFRFIKLNSKDLRMFPSIISKGLPKGLMQGMSFGRSLILNTLVIGALGSLGMSVMAVLINVLMISNIFVSGTCDAVLPIVGTLYGEGDTFGVKQAFKSATKILFIAASVLTVFFLSFPTFVGTWFGITEPENLAVLAPALRFFALYLPFSSTNVLLQNFYNTTGRIKLASLIAVLDGFVYVCAFAYILVLLFSPTFLWLCYALSGACTLLTIILICHIFKSRGLGHGILLLRERPENQDVLDVTIRANSDDATGLSQKVISFLDGLGVGAKTANRLGIAIEEMAVNTMNIAHGNEPGIIDITVRVGTDDITVRFRDDGEIFDPVAYVPAADESALTDGVEIVKKLASNVDYMRQLGFNTTVLRFNRSQIDGK